MEPPRSGLRHIPIAVYAAAPSLGDNIEFFGTHVKWGGWPFGCPIRHRWDRRRRGRGGTTPKTEAVESPCQILRVCVLLAPRRQRSRHARLGRAISEGGSFSVRVTLYVVDGEGGPIDARSTYGAGWMRPTRLHRRTCLRRWKTRISCPCDWGPFSSTVPC